MYNIFKKKLKYGILLLKGRRKYKMNEQKNQRVIATITTEKSIDELTYRIDYFFNAKKYKLINYNNELLFGFYNQLLDTKSFPTYMKVKVDNGLVTVVAFVSKNGSKEEVFEENDILNNPNKNANYTPTQVLLTDFIDFIEAIKDDNSKITIEKKDTNAINIDFTNNLYKSNIKNAGTTKQMKLKNNLLAILFVILLAIIYLLFFNN